MTLEPPPNGGINPRISGSPNIDDHRSSYSNVQDWPPRHADAYDRDGGPLPKPRYPHIKDLQARADTTIKELSAYIPIRTLLGRAKLSANQVNTDVSFKRQDRAYVEYLISSDILLNLIPRHKDYPSLNTDRGEWGRIYKNLCKQNDTQHGMFKEIYDMIVEDNLKSGLRPMGDSSQFGDRDVKAQRRQPNDLNPRPLSVPGRPKSSLEEGNELFLAPPRYSSPQLSTNARSSSQDQHHSIQTSTPFKQRPSVHPKPHGLQTYTQSSARGTDGVAGAPIEERFSQLRVQGKSNGTRPEVNVGYVEMPSPTQFTPPSSNSSPSQVHVSIPGQGGWPPMGKPSGPREMPPPPQYPPPPAKIPLDAPDVSLPRAPSPAYNPSKGLQTSSHAPPQLNRKRSIIGTEAGGGKLSSALTASRQYVETDADFYSSGLNEIDGEAKLGSSHPLDLPHATVIKATELYEFLRKNNVLVIDVRSRDEYDQGHIYAKSIICIEPVGLRIGLSAEELEDRLIVSPADELALFERRNEFDLVVYYDQKTSTNRFLSGPPTTTAAPALRALHDTLYEFNAYKPLRRPPALLVGGLEAWIDLVGTQSLKPSNTVVSTGSSRNRYSALPPGRPIGRVPMASHNSSLEVRKRRLRGYYPLDADEERTWRETARKEEVESPEYEQGGSDVESMAANGGEMISPVVHSYEEFLRKFPEPSGIKQSMMIPSPASGPAPPARPSPSLPNVPSRPPPAVPRPSYSGVSERDSSPLSPISRQPLSAPPPLYTARSVSHYLKLPRTGLINFSVTCYMNATIQCLLATIPLSQFFLDNRWRDYTQKNWKGSNGIMPEIYANLIRSLWRNDVQAVRPTSLRNFCARLNSEWGLDRQQDAKEYLDFLLDCLHEDLNIHWQRGPLQPLSTREEAVRETMPVRKVSRIEWDRYSHRESSFISSLFAGQHASRLRCTTCQHTSTTYEAFYSISVEIPRSGRGDIHDCLKSYCQEEMLSGDEVWKCSYCKCEREATKQIIITRVPQFLVVHFKRFSASKTESARKVHTPINFPLHGFNMEPYMLPSASRPTSDQGPPAMTNDAVDAAITPPYLYDAYAVMRHIGQSGGGGHYISLVRDAPRGCWRKFDDERVTDFDPNKLKPELRLQNEQAYLVFYGRAAAR